MNPKSASALALPDGLRRYLTQYQLSEELQISERTLERKRCDGTGPNFKKAGRRVIYAREDVDAWLDAQTYTSTAEVKFGAVREED